MKRPKLLISTERNYFINWTKTGNDVVFHDSFDGDIRALMNDLHQIDGFRGFEILPEFSMLVHVKRRKSGFRQIRSIPILHALLLFVLAFC